MKRVVPPIQYPEDFRKQNVVDIRDEVIQRWINEGIKELEKKEAGEYFLMRSGNAMVMVIKEYYPRPIYDPRIKGRYEYLVLVSKDYLSLEVENACYWN